MTTEGSWNLTIVNEVLLTPPDSPGGTFLTTTLLHFRRQKNRMAPAAHFRRQKNRMAPAAHFRRQKNRIAPAALDGS